MRWFKWSFKDGCNEILDWIFAILLFVPLVICLIVMLLYLPFDYIKYRRSALYKKEGKRYIGFIARNPSFIFYNEIVRNNLPIEFYNKPDAENWADGGFVHNGTLIVAEDWYRFTYDKNTDKWLWTVTKNQQDDEGESDFTVDSLVEMMLEDANAALLGRTVCDKAVFLVKRKNIDNIELAKNDPRFVIYEKNIAEVVSCFLAAE